MPSPKSVPPSPIKTPAALQWAAAARALVAAGRRRLLQLKAALGVYGAMAVRAALGAQRSQVVALVLARATRFALAGIAIGLLGGAKILSRHPLPPAGRRARLAQR